MEKKALIRAMKRSISEVLETMFFLPVDISDTVSGEMSRHSENDEMAAVKMDFSGPFSGSFFLFIPEKFSVSLAADFMGKDKETVSQENVIETSKEIINMIAGNTFTIFDDQAVFNLNIPEGTAVEQRNHSNGLECELLVRTETMENFLILKMVVS